VRLCSSYGDALGCLRRGAFAIAVIDLSLSGTETDPAGRWAPLEPEQGLEGYQLLASTRAFLERELADVSSRQTAA